MKEIAGSKVDDPFTDCQARSEPGFVVEILYSGATGYVQPASESKTQYVEHEQRKRGEQREWSDRTTRNNKRALLSADIETLEASGYGYALTFTFGECPPCADSFHALRKHFIRKLKRWTGMKHYHWILEFSWNGKPHLHLAVWFAKRQLTKSIKALWIQCANSYKPNLKGQKAREMFNTCGWLEYLAKGKDERRKQTACIPSHWPKTGQVWNHSRGFPSQPVEKMRVSRKTWYVIRRVINRLYISEKRKALENAKSEREYRKRLSEYCKAKDYLKRDRRKSSVLPFSCWINNRNMKLLANHFEAIV